MRILRGSLFGMCLFGFGTIVYLYLKIFRNLQPHSSFDIRSLLLLTTLNPFWWGTLAVCLILGLAVAHRWSEPRRS
jgi:hypothetical protein